MGRGKRHSQQRAVSAYATSPARSALDNERWQAFLGVTQAQTPAQVGTASRQRQRVAFDTHQLLEEHRRAREERRNNPPTRCEARITPRRVAQLITDAEYRDVRLSDLRLEKGRILAPAGV